LSMEQLVHPGRITLMRMIELFTTGPAGVLGLDSGRLAEGGVADVTIFDPELSWTYDVNKTLSRSKNSPFDGHEFKGGPVATIVGGEMVWRRE